MKATLIDLFTSKKFLAALTAVVVYAAGRFGFDVDTAVLDRILAAFLVYVGAQGVADVGKGAAQVREAAFGARPRSMPAGLETGAALVQVEPPSSSATRAPIGTVAVLALVALGLSAAGSLTACSGAKSAASGAKAAVVDCVHADQGPIVRLLIELGGDAVAAALHGQVDWAVLEAEAETQGVVVGGCAFSQFVHGMAAAPRPPAPDTAVSALWAPPAVPDPATAALERLRAASGGVRWSTPAGVL